MKVNKNILALMALMAAGVAGAQNATDGTAAGTTINNTAHASYADPNSGATSNSDSNTVTTVVLPKPGFDIVYTGSTPTDGGNQNAIGTTSVKYSNQVPGAAVPTDYTVVNNGNTSLQVNVAANVTGATTTNGSETVKYYYVNADGTLGAEITGPITLPIDNPATAADEGLVNIRQVITLPNGAKPTDVYGASPEGSVAGTGTGTVTDNGNGTYTVVGNGYASGSTNYEEDKTKATDLQFVNITMINLNNSSVPPTTPTTPVNPDGSTYTPPTTGTVKIPNLPAGPDGTPNDPPTNPVTGYSDPSGTPITGLGTNNQEAYPKADPDNTDAVNTVGNTNSVSGANDTVTFTNTVTNNGGAADKVQLFPIDPATGALVNGAVFANNTFTYTDPNGNAVTVQFLDPSGNPIPVASGATYPTLNIPAGSTAYYTTKVTYPDTTDSATTPNVVINIGADSLTDAGIVSDSSTIDTIHPAAAQFGDTTTALGTVPTPAPIQTVTPGVANSGATIDASPDSTDGTAVFPMDVANMGTYPDDFSLKGVVKDASGATVNNISVTYYYNDGTGLKPLPADPNNSGAYLTPVVAVGTEIKVYAVINVPTGTAPGNYTVSQSATGVYSTIPMTDINDIITVKALGSVVVAKFTKVNTAANVTTGVIPAADAQHASSNPATVTAGAPDSTQIGNPAGYDGINATAYKPADTYDYKIIGKNNYNKAITGFFLYDTLPANVTYNAPSVAGSTSACSNGTDVPLFTGTAPATLVNGVSLPANTVYCPVISLAAGATETMTVNVTVK